LSLLGIKFSPSIVETADRVWKDAFGYLHGILRESAFRRFTLYQRVNFIKTRALSRTVCIAQILQCNSQMAYRILSVVMNYIWKDHKGRMYTTCQSGGFGNATCWSILSFIVSLPHIQSLNRSRKPRMTSSLLRFWMSFPLRIIPDSTVQSQRRPKHVTLRRLRCTRNIADSQVYMPWTSFTYGQCPLRRDPIVVPIRSH
jgi:hypothetical protein